MNDTSYITVKHIKGIKQNSTVHYAGESALYDSFTGLIPCKVKLVKKTEYGNKINTGYNLTIVIKKDGKGFKKGEVLEVHTHMVIPRKNIFIRNKHYRINTNYTWSKTI